MCRNKRLPTESSSYPKRQKTQTHTDSQKQDIAKNLMRRGWKDFNVSEGQQGDGTQDTQVQMIFTITKPNGSRYRKWFDGKTGVGHGHAEIDALYQIYEQYFEQRSPYKLQKDDKYSIEVVCESKPCCVHCAAIMGLLNITGSPKTEKSKKTAGVSYSIPQKVKQMLIALVKPIDGDNSDPSWTITKSDIWDEFGNIAQRNLPNFD